MPKSGVEQRIIQVTPAIFVVEGILRRTTYATNRTRTKQGRTRLGQVYPLGPCLVLRTDLALKPDIEAWDAITRSQEILG